MPIDPTLFRRVNIHSAVPLELSFRSRLLPRRWDYAALAPHAAAVETWLRPRLRKGPTGRIASVVFADKDSRGARPLHMMTLEDRVLYRALVAVLTEALPERVRGRRPIAEFKQAPLDVPGTEYITKTDVTAYYEYVDHELLVSELLAQTGDELAADALGVLLASVLGRRVGLPQVHPASDVLGDTYIDPVRRHLLRRGHTVFTYSDDFRIASPSLSAARASLEACAVQVRALGLVLNERKTFTFGTENYRASLTSFADAEQRLFSEGDLDDPFATLGFLDSGYEDLDGDEELPSTLGASPVVSSIDEDDAFDTGDGEEAEEVDSRRLQAAQRAWELWENQDESEQGQATQEAAITQSLLGRALPALGAAEDGGPLSHLSELLRREPALTPQIAAYADAYGKNGGPARANLRSALNDVVTSDILSPWQGMWLAQVAGGLQRRSRATQAYEDWLARCITGGHDALAATSAAAIGRTGRGDSDLVAAAIERLGPEWRRLAFWGLIGLDRNRAVATADDELDRLLLDASGTE
ncbi:RNA-directed DNA polymerase [Actinoplanes sp. NPDC051475]|uniref:RNA-directed DNA polymerase n=1 Tax=Actinoplanes sp. NPDC051475 TaxID=3157225 RepID=UPI00344FB66F